MIHPSSIKNIGDSNDDYIRLIKNLKKKKNKIEVYKIQTK